MLAASLNFGQGHSIEGRLELVEGEMSHLC